MSGPMSIADVHHIPVEPGIYHIYSDCPIGWLNWSPSSGPTYIGQAADGLRRRIEKVHAGDTGRSTLRRTLGALLKEQLGLDARPRPSKDEPKAVNFTNYVFELGGDERLTTWMTEHLSVSFLVCLDTKGPKDASIAEHEPPLNITGWQNPFAPEIRAARSACAREARTNRSP